MRFVHEMTYDAAPEAVAAMMADPAFREAVCEHQQVLEYAVSVDDAGGALVVSVDQVQEARGMPSYAQKFVGDQIEIAQRETWRQPTIADVVVTVPGKPVRMTGTIVLEDDGDRTLETVSETSRSRCR